MIELGEDEEVEMEEQPLLPPGTEDELEYEVEIEPEDPPPPGEEGGGGRTVPAPVRAAIAEFQFQLGMEPRREENWRPSPLPPRRRLSGGGGLGEAQIVSPVIQRGGPPVARSGAEGTGRS